MAIDTDIESILVALTLVNFFEFFVFHEVLIYWHINVVIKYWA